MLLSNLKRLRPYFYLKDGGVENRRGEDSVSVVFCYYTDDDSLISKEEFPYDEETIIDDIQFRLDDLYAIWEQDSRKKAWSRACGGLLVYRTLFERALKSKRSRYGSKHWKKKNFYLPFSKKLLYNLGMKEDKGGLDEVVDESNLRLLERIAARSNSYEPFNQWFEEFKLVRAGRVGHKSRISADKAFLIFKSKVEEIQNGN